LYSELNKVCGHAVLFVRQVATAELLSSHAERRPMNEMFVELSPDSILWLIVVMAATISNLPIGTAAWLPYKVT
jgi:hypothetical protein